MKRILVMSLIVMTILLSFTGCEWFASEQTDASTEDAAVGKLEVNWDPDAASKITLDGDLSEWVKSSQNMDDLDILSSLAGSVAEGFGVMPLYDENGLVYCLFVELDETTDFCYVPVDVGNVSAYSGWETVYDENDSTYYYKVPVYAEIENGENYYYKVPVSDENKSAYSKLVPVYDENESTYYYKVSFLRGMGNPETSENDPND